MEIQVAMETILMKKSVFQLGILMSVENYLLDMLYSFETFLKLGKIVFTELVIIGYSQ